MDIILTFDKSQISHFLELFECEVKAMKFDVLIISNVMVTLGPFFK